MSKNTWDYSSLIRTALLSVALCATAQAATTTVFHETFTGTDGTDINNWAVETPQTAGEVWKDQATVKISNNQMELSQGGTFGKAWAPFYDERLAPGTTSFTFSYDFSVIGSTWTDTGSSFYGGIGNGDGSELLDRQLGIGFYLTGDFADDTSVTLRAGNDGNPNAFDDVVTTLTRADANADWAADFSFTYTIATGAIDYSVNDTVIGTGTYTGAIGGVWFKAEGVSNVAPHPGYLIDDVLLTAVPEPGAYALIAGMLGMVYVMVRRRK